MGLMSGAAGVVQAWTVMTVAPDSLLGYELTVLAAVVLGGTSLIGGRGTLTGTLLGLYMNSSDEKGERYASVDKIYNISIFDMYSAFPWLEQGGRTGETTGF